MSTFRGVVQEFPDIRIDYFRSIPGLRPPRKCFLSHVHSDHLTGLETPNFHSCFIYCSAATREILLRLEKQSQRLNFHQGVLEKRNVTYKHLDKLLKTIPIETPTRIELEPGNEIQVTLFDANHCTGAVMFLVEGGNKAILYTGDIRSEPWFVNNLTRNPFLIEYTSGLRRLNCIYLDTSNTRDIAFPPKADGLKELLQKVSRYPDDTVFHFTAWTFGYEEVWMALSRALKSQIHVDDYKMRLYASLRGKPHDPKDHTDDSYLSGPFLAHEGPALTGYKCGNALREGCLTTDPNVRIHSCEKGLHCDKLNDKTVWIRPIVTRTASGEMSEVGVGGGGEDLTRRLEIELDSEGVIDQFLGLFADTESLVKRDVKRMLEEGLKSRRTAMSLEDLGLDPSQGDISLKKIKEALVQSVADKYHYLNPTPAPELHFEALSRLITFPYSRHSSYPELCHLVKSFNPRDVYPCTVDDANWDEHVSMENLFGGYCDETIFRHDNEMRALQEQRHLKYDSQQTQTTASSEVSSQVMIPSIPAQQRAMPPPSSPILPITQISKPYLIRRNSKGKLRPFDIDGNEVAPPAQQMQKAISQMFSELPAEQIQEIQEKMTEMISAIESTPPKIITAASPGSSSQDLRRKAIHGELEGQVKRARLSYDDPVSSSPSSAVNSTAHVARGDEALSAVIEISYESAPAANVDAECETSQLARDPYTRSFDCYSWDYGWDEPPSYLDKDEEDDRNTILRCKECGHEMWTLWMTYLGFCNNCSSLAKQSADEEIVEDENQCPYYEIIESEAGPRPEIETAEFPTYHLGSIDHLTRENIVGDYLDEHSDAYDTFDEESNHRSEYDSEDSFIDDADIPEPPNEDENGNGAAERENVVEYRAMFQELQRKHTRLLITHEGMMQDLVDSDYAYDSSGESYPSADIDIEETNEYEAFFVDVRPPDPQVVELVLSQVDEQSQESEISEGRIRARVEAFEAAAGEEWNNVSMVSTGDNHTFPEIEL